MKAAIPGTTSCDRKILINIHEPAGHALACIDLPRVLPAARLALFVGIVRVFVEREPGTGARTRQLAPPSACCTW